MKTKEIINKIYSFLDSAKARANIQYAGDKEARDVVHNIFYELDNFFITLEEELKGEEIENAK